MSRAGPERRNAPRWRADDCPWLSSGRLRPGHDVSVIDLSADGARVDAPVRLVPGARVELLLAGPGWRWTAAATVIHCHVSGLARTGPRYLAGLRFSQRLEIALIRGSRPPGRSPAG